jgi:hypothetical protein
MDIVRTISALLGGGRHLLLLLGSLTPLAAAPVGLVEFLELVGISGHF